jgi:uncharacterized protein (UPF0248 family)
MVPIQDILHRIAWDPAFGAGGFVIGYRDRVRGRTVRIPFERIVLGEGRGFSFDVIGADGAARMIPYHRVREVLRDGKVIWRRQVAREDDTGDDPARSP